MAVFVVYKDRSDHAREVLDYMRDFKNQTGHKIEVVDPDSRHGADFCRIYDIVEYPTIVALTRDGIYQNMWRGRHLPPINEVVYYV